MVATPRRRRLEVQGRSASGDPISQSVLALSWSDVRRIVEKFERLKPYSDDEPLLEIEEHNFDGTGNQRPVSCLAISAKRYCLFVAGDEMPSLLFVSDGDRDVVDDGSESDGRVEARGVVKRSEHGLGHLLNPYDPDVSSNDWIEEGWVYLLTELGFGTPRPS